MVKKLFFGTLIVLVAGAVTLSQWQPKALQKKIVDIIAQKVADTTPYEFTVESVSGNFFRYFTLHNVRIKPKGSPVELASLGALQLGLRWRALLHKEIVVNKIVIENPVIRLTLDRDKKLVLPAMPATPKKKSPMLFFVERLEIGDGRLILRNESVRPASTLTLEPIEASLSLSPQSVTISSVKVGLAPGELDAKGKVKLSQPLDVMLRAQTKRFPIHVLWSALRRPPGPVRLTHSGTWDIHGQGAVWKIKTSGSLDGSRLRVEAAVDLQGPYRADIQLEPLALRNVWQTPMTERMGALSASITVSAPSLASKAVTASGRVRLDPQRMKGTRPPTVEARLDLERGRGQALVKATAEGLQAATTSSVDLISMETDTAFQLSLANMRGLSQWAPALSAAGGTVVSTGTLKGPIQTLTLNAFVQARDGRFRDKTFVAFNADLRGRVDAKGELQARGALTDFVLHKDQPSPWDIARLDFDASGPAAQLASSATARFRNDDQFHVDGFFERPGQGWQVSWNTMEFAPAKGAPIKTTGPGSLTSRGDGSYDIRSLAITNGHGHIDLARARVQKENVDVELTARSLEIEPLAQLFLGDRRYQGSANAEVRVTGSRHSPHGRIALQLSDGQARGFAFKEFDIEALLQPPWIIFSPFVIHMKDTASDIHGQGRVPMHLLDPSQPDLPIDFTVVAPHLNPQELTAASPDAVFDKNSTASFQLKIHGRPPDVALDGRFMARAPRLEIKSAGLDLRDLNVDIVSREKSVEIKQFTAKTKKGDLSVSGKSVLPNLNFRVRAKNFQIDIPKQLQARMDIALLIDGDLQGPDVAGDVAIKDATYTMPKKTKKEAEKEKQEKQRKEIEEQAQLRGATTPSSVWEGTTLNIHSQWPRNVWYRDGLSKIETSGDVRVRKDEGKAQIYLSGTINIVRGSYNAYGRDFVLNSGDIIFTGPPDIDPILNLEALYSSGGTVVYLDVTGTAKKPKIAFRSNPPLSQQDIISVLVLGQPLNQVGPSQTSETSKSQQAEALAGSMVSNYLTNELRQSGMDFVGLDVVRVEPTTSGNRLTIGRYIGDKLFVSYGQPLQTGATRVFDANYYLNKYWTILGETGASADSFMDLLFRYPLNQPPNTRYVPAPGVREEPIQLPTTNPYKVQ